MSKKATCTVCCAPLTNRTDLLCEHCTVVAPESVPRKREGETMMANYPATLDWTRREDGALVALDFAGHYRYVIAGHRLTIVHVFSNLCEGEGLYPTVGTARAIAWDHAVAYSDKRAAARR